MIKITVDDRQIEAKEGMSLLQACLENEIYIPNLCFLEQMRDPPASCRLCFVEIEGENKPVTSCKIKPTEGMVVRTDTDAVRRLQRTALRLLLTVHQVKCRTCPSNRVCELQRMAKFLGVRLKPRRFEHIDRDTVSDQEHPLFEYDLNRCVLCGRCVFICQKLTGYSLLTFARRGFDTVISSFGETEPAKFPCKDCLACVGVCPVSAIFLKGVQNHDAASGR